MQKVTKTFVVFLFAGAFFNEHSVNEIASVDAEVDIPAGAFAYRFFLRDDVMDEEGETYQGKVYGETGTTFPDGEVYDEAMLAEEFERDSILYQNIIGNGYTHAVKTRRGNWQSLKTGDKVTKDGEVIFG